MITVEFQSNLSGVTGDRARGPVDTAAAQETAVCSPKNLVKT